MPYALGHYLMGIMLVLGLPQAAAGDNGDTLFNQIHMQASAGGDIENDLLEVTLAVEVQGRQPGQLARRVNETMARALDRVKARGNVEARTLSYQTHPVYRDQVVIAWRASQQLHLKSRRITELTELVGVLQEELQVKRMQFSVSPEARRKAENALISEALQAFKQRILTVKPHMDGSDYRIVSLNIDTGHPSPVTYRERAVAMSMSDAAAPAVESGTSRVTVTVSGSVQFY